MCGAVKEKYHIYHEDGPLHEDEQLVVFCAGHHLAINDQLIFSNKVKPTRWKSFSKCDKLTALTLVSAGRNFLYTAYYTRLQGLPSDHENLQAFIA